jgi:hypothetical protein
MALQAVTYSNNLLKLEWLRSYSAMGRGNGKRRLGIFKRARDQWVCYKCGEVILVEVLGDGDFRDPEKDVIFHVKDRGQIRLF